MWETLGKDPEELGSPDWDAPHLEAAECVLHRALVELDHVYMHVAVVAADVSLSAAIGHCAKAEGRVLVLGPLELWAETLVKAFSSELLCTAMGRDGRGQVA